MIMAEHMKRAVHYKSEQLFSSPDALSPGVLASDLGANIHVTDNRSATTNSAEPEGDHAGSRHPGPAARGTTAGGPRADRHGGGATRQGTGRGAD